MNVNQSIIRIIGLLGEVKEKELPSFLKRLTSVGYERDRGPLLQGQSDTRSIQFLRDYFYADFRNIMFLEAKDDASVRLVNTTPQTVSLGYGFGPNRTFYSLKVVKSEIFLFKGQIGLFSLSLVPEQEQVDVYAMSNILSIVRSFDTRLQDDTSWVDWISEHYLAGQKLRGDDVVGDEYSGSKFKVYSVIDGDFSEMNRSHLLYDLATTSRIGSGAGVGADAPDPDYIQQVMSNRIGVFNNWEALCLFDSFCCIGTNQLKGFGQTSWDYTYFRIYLFRIFFKYNLYRYNSMIHNKGENTVTYRDQFEQFLNKYNISHISFNFLGNELFKKIGDALELESELGTFRERINNLSAAIQEERQTKTNFLLQAVTVLSGISSVGPVFDILKEVEEWLGWSDPVFYSVLAILIIIIGLGVLYYLMPEKVKKWIPRK
jgi:hypothetical protein